MENVTKQQILSSSSIWLSILLNFIPGLGTGYLYQRRWKAYWLTFLVSFIWISLGAFRDLGIDSSDPAAIQGDPNGIIGLLFIAIFTSLEAGYAVRRSREGNNLD